MSELAKETERSVNNLVNSDTFDPGAVTPLKADAKDKNTDQSSPETSENPPEKTVVGEIPEVAEQIEEAEDAIKEQLYGSGKNPKLSSNNDDDT
jgi:hypothetical protein